MKKLQYTFWILAISLITGACSTNDQEKVSTQKKEIVQPVKVLTLEKIEINRSINYTSTLQAFEHVDYAPSQPGRINKIFVDVGDRVTKGQTLVKMDKTQLTQALLQVENARTHFYRMDTLRKLNSISEQQYDQAKTQYEQAVSNLEFLKENTTLKAPFSGIITEKYFEEGELYSAAPNTQSGKSAIITLMQLSPLKAIVHITENYFPEIREGMKATITTDIYPDQKFTGVVSQVYPVIDAATRTFKVEIKVNNPEKKLRPGMFTKVFIDLKDDKALMVPAISVVKQEGTNNRYVFIHNNGRAQKIRVKIGDRYNDKVELRSDKLKPGMDIIIAGQGKLMDGDKVQIRN
ncbi:Macrolide-specific efflux protein MacA precursor [Salinivirga cyanobacteriivorans]|uniref:Macrolide-specific efflux protein MacA n=1 Tax=Salinivirga cyanobacteriivorans TaxID=1307839 RepID=A0A0S2I0H4_9BACT|nr:efflux RND transporter periplasmic adaptor subunit [Salinivirga cyanobacteriivorans]ALO15839.1 Macrolide-specific efflux protein MacA precursor [Salinivirga cyanobacteriivorans]